MMGTPVSVLLNVDASRQVDVQFWILPRKYGDVTCVCRWLVEVDGTQPQCQGTSTVHSPEGSMGERVTGGEAGQENGLSAQQEESSEGYRTSESHVAGKPGTTGLTRVCWILCLQEHCDIGRSSRPQPGISVPTWYWAILTAQGGRVLLVPRDKGQGQC